MPYNFPEGEILLINKDLNWGVYAGLQSSWQFTSAEDSLKKYGLFVSYKSGDFKSNRFTSTIAYNAVYHGKFIFAIQFPEL